MDRLHITEFGSDEFFRKQRALEQAAAAQNASPSTEPTTSHASTFILPVGHSRPPNGKRRASNEATKPSDQKIRSVGHDLSKTRNERRPSFTRPLASFRSKVPTLHRPDVDFDVGRSVEEPLATKQISGYLFLSLPSELQAQVISLLPIRSILDLRLVCRSFHEMISLNEPLMVRYHVQHSIPSYALRLYPLPDRSERTLRYLCGIWHRLHVASKTTTLICDYVAKDLYLRDTKAKFEEFRGPYRRMRQRLMPLVFTIFHFFETYSDLHIKHLKSNGTPLSRQAYTIHPIEKQVMNLYGDETLLRVHEVLPLFLSSFSVRLRKPTYMGRLETLAKGYKGERHPDEVYLAILMVGGVRQVERFWQIRELNDRIHAVDSWYNSLTITLSPKSSSARAKIVRLSPFHRKRSTFELATTENSAGHDAVNCKDWYCLNTACAEMSVSRHHHHRNNTDLIHHNSLSAGPPMAPLPKEEYRPLLSDLPPLDCIWTLTAEALILERGIVDSPNNIKKNTAVLSWLTSPINQPSSDDLLEEWNPPGTFNDGISMEIPRGVWDS